MTVIVIHWKEGKHELEIVSPDDIRIIEPASGVTYFDDFDDEDFRKMFLSDYFTVYLIKKLGKSTGSPPEVGHKSMVPRYH